MGPIAKTLVFALFVAVVSAHYHHKFRQTKVTPFSRAMDHYGREMRRLHRDSPELSQEEKQAAANRAASKHVTKIQNPSSVRKHLAQKETLMNLEREATEEEEGVATGFVLPAQSVCEELGLLAEEREGTAEEEEEEVCFPETVDCGKFTRFFRTVDGSCNNVEFPLNGAANTPFPRLLPAFYDPEEPFEGLVGNGAFSFYQLAEAEEERAANRMLGSGLKKLRMSSGLDRSRANLDRRRSRSPEELNELAACEAIFPHNLQSARAVSLSVHIEEIPDGSTDTDDEFDGQVVNSLILMQIGQLIDHDLTLTPETESEACCTLEEQEDENCISIPVQLGDPFTTFNEFTADDNTAECLELTRSTEFCPSEPGQVREQFNAITAWIDASNVYGSSLEQVCNLREFSGGRMAVSSDIVEGEDLLPQVDGAFTAGDIRANEQSGLNAIHTLFVREHNRIADEIASSTEFGDLNDEEIYQVAKRINEVQMQNLVFGENGFVNTVLGDDLYEDFDIDFNGRDKWDDLLSGDIFNVFATAAFRFGHTFIQNFVPFVDPTTLAIEEDVGFDLRDAFFNPDIITENGASVVLTGTLQRNSRTFDAFLTGDLTNNLQPGADQDRSDLAARNIQRGRDHGLAPYNAYREGCGLRPLCDWNDRPDNINEDAWANLEAVYNHPSDIEAFPGLLSEDSVEDGIVGETLGCLLGIQFANLKFADRFYYTFNDGLDGQLTEEMTNAVLAFDGGLTLGNILCQNIPGLVSARVNPFFLDSEELDCSTVTGIDISSFAEAMISSSRK